MLTRWLPSSENKLPPNASHQVGVGAFVMNERREVLVVQERSGPLRGQGVWKMPTGLVQVGWLRGRAGRGRPPGLWPPHAASVVVALLPALGIPADAGNQTPPPLPAPILLLTSPPAARRGHQRGGGARGAGGDGHPCAVRRGAGHAPGPRLCLWKERHVLRGGAQDGGGAAGACAVHAVHAARGLGHRFLAAAAALRACCPCTTQPPPAQPSAAVAWSVLQELCMQEDELVGVRWMGLEEYLAVPFTAARPLFQKIHAAILAYVNGTYRCAICVWVWVWVWVCRLDERAVAPPASRRLAEPTCLARPCCACLLPCRRGLHGRKLATGFSARQDLLLFGEAADREGADQQSGEDAWIGLDTAAAAADAGGAEGGAAGGAAAAGENPAS